jgi:hypothetical protein
MLHTLRTTRLVCKRGRCACGRKTCEDSNTKFSLHADIKSKRDFAGPRGTSRDFALLRVTSRYFAGLRGTSRDFAGLRGTSRDFAGLREALRDFAGLRETSRGFAGLRGTSRNFEGLRGIPYQQEISTARKETYAKFSTKWAWGAGRF